jgi:hypothetical protein
MNATSSGTSSGRARAFIFHPVQNTRLFAFTRDMTGSNLPHEYGPWRAYDSDATKGGVIGAEFSHSDAVMSAIGVRGFYLSRPDGLPW